MLSLLHRFVIGCEVILSELFNFLGQGIACSGFDSISVFVFCSYVLVVLAVCEAYKTYQK